MSVALKKPPHVEGEPFVGWPDIAEATGKAIKQSVSVNTAKRYAALGRDNRLPVYRYQSTRVFLMEEDLALWARAWLTRRPSGARPAGASKSKAA